MSFESWLARVDKYMLSSVGVTHSDIADWHWRDAYTAGMTPQNAASESLAADGSIHQVRAGCFNLFFWK